MNRRTIRFGLAAATACLLALGGSARASQAYGSIDNFDVVNDNDVPCHGFEIEIEDAHSTDITYTYDWNHYGVPRIAEDNSDPLHPRVRVRYESRKNPDGSWASYTAVPTGPVSPTDGHQFTDPSVNFGGEHFGVGFYGAPTAVRYRWLVDDGAGNLTYGTIVNIATPTFNYAPPAGGPAQVEAVIAPPPPPDPPVLEFGEPTWVKETRTETHNSNRVELRDLVTDDPDDDHDRNWRNEEPDEVEVEWQLLQVDYNAGDGGNNGELAGAPEELPDGDEIITRRYDFFKYVGPIDAETGEALADSVGPDGVHGDGIKQIDGIDVDLSTVEVVGDFIGAQMAGFDAGGQIGLIDHVQEGEVGQPYVDRTVVVGGTEPIVTEVTGSIPDGMTFDTAAGVLFGTPEVPGSFAFTVHSVDASGGDVSTTYNLAILPPGEAPAPQANVTTMASPPAGGGTSGAGVYDIGVTATVTAWPNPGYSFVNWTDGGSEASTSPSYDFTTIANRELVANFVPTGGPDTTSPASAASVGDATQVGGDIVGTYAADDGAGSGVASVRLYAKAPGGAWADAGAVAGGTWAYTPMSGDGEYRFATAATDNATNAETAPTGADPGDATVLWNDAANSPFAVSVAGDGAFVLPMAPGLDVEVVLSGVSNAGTVAASRTEGNGAPTGMGGLQFVDQSWTLSAGGGLAFGSAQVTFGYDEGLLGGLSEGQIDGAWRDDAGVVTQLPVAIDATNNRATVTTSGFSSWYLGNVGGLPVELDGFTVE